MNWMVAKVNRADYRLDMIITLLLGVMVRSGACAESPPLRVRGKGRGGRGGVRGRVTGGIGRFLRLASICDRSWLRVRVAVEEW
jgi:hypothetical protein